MGEVGQFLRNKNYFISDHSSFEIKFENYRSISIFKIFLDEMEFLFTFSKINFSNEAILSCSSNFQILSPSPLPEKRKRSCRNISFSRFCTASPCIYTYILYTVSNVVARERDREKLKILERGGSKKRETLYGGSNNYVCTCVCVCAWMSYSCRTFRDRSTLKPGAWFTPFRPYHPRVNEGIVREIFASKLSIPPNCEIDRAPK